MTEDPGKSELAACSEGRWLERFPLRRRDVIITAVVVLAVYLAGVTGRWWPRPDSALYLAVGRSLAEGEGFRFNGEINVTTSPGLPVILAGIRRLFGPGFWAPNIFVALCGLAAIGLTYLAISRLTDRRMGLMIALASGLSYRFYLNAHEILTDMPFVLVFWAMFYSLLRFQRGSWFWLVLAGVLSAVGMTVRIPGLLAIGVLAVGVALDRSVWTRKGRRLVSGAAILAGAAAAAVGLYVLARTASPEMPGYMPQLSGRMISSNLLQLGQGLYNLTEVLSKIITGQEIVFPIGVAAMLLMAAGVWWAWRSGRRLLVIIVVLYPLAFIFLRGGGAIRMRYWLPVQAFYLYAIIEGLCWAVRWISRRRGRTARPSTLLKTVTVFAAVVIACNAPKVLRWASYYAYLSHTPTYYEKVNRGAYKELYPVAEVIKTHSRPEDRVGIALSNQLRMLHFLTRRRMVSCPDGERIGANDALRIADFIRSHAELRLIVLDLRSKEQPEFILALESHFKKMVDRGSLEVLFDSEDCRVYRRLQPGAHPVATGPLATLMP